MFLLSSETEVTQEWCDDMTAVQVQASEHWAGDTGPANAGHLVPVAVRDHAVGVPHCRLPPLLVTTCATAMGQAQDSSLHKIEDVTLSEGLSPSAD